MIERTTIPLSDTFIQTIQNNSETRKEVLAETLKTNESNIERLLSEYYYDERGHIYGSNLKEDSIVFENHTTGNFKINFFISYFMGCQDITYDDKGNMLIHFEIDIAEKVMKLVGENRPEREPDAY